MGFQEEMKNKLLQEKLELEQRLSKTGIKNPDRPGDWETIVPDFNPQRSSLDELADELEEYEVRKSVEGDLEMRLADVNDALARIEAGTYGICEKGGEKISEKRVLANPAARTCVEHSN